VAAVTAMPAVGKLVSHAMSNLGAIATQAATNPYYGIDGLKLLSAGRDAKTALDELISNDPHRQKRQIGIIDANGIVSAWSGNRIPRWGGDIVGEDFAAQGNRLTGGDVVQAIADAFTRHRELDLAKRLLLAIEAGHACGGDRQREQSGTILVYDTEEYPLWDVRVDDAADPVKELHRLFGVFEQQLLPNMKKLPTRKEPAGRLTDEDEGIG
jgi:uncharacterized Ntn-hydrolase superfamily protein